MHKGLIEQITKMRDAAKQLSKASDNVIKNEPHMHKKVLSEERIMAQADGIPYSEEEMQHNAMRQMDNSPFRLAMFKAKDKFEEAAKRG